MSLINVTPSTGKQTPVSINLNRLRLRAGDRVVYWSPAAEGVKIDTIDASASDDGNWFTIDGERLIVTAFWARIPAAYTGEQCAAIIADFAAIGRSQLSFSERMDICHRHWLED